MRHLVRRKPAYPTFTKVVNDIFNDDFINRFDEQLSLWNGTQPAVNIFENNDGYAIEVAAPGFAKEDIKVEVDNDVLTISSEKEFEHKEEDGKYNRREFKYSAFSRTFNLPDTVDATNISAAYENGILKIMVPMKPEAKPVPARTIEIA